MSVMADQSVKRSRRTPRQGEADPEQIIHEFTPTLKALARQMASRPPRHAEAGTLDSKAPRLLPDPRSTDVAVGLREVLGKAIERLPRPERLVMTLYYYEKLTMREIAAILAVTEARLCQIHSRAVRALKTQLQSAA